MSPSFLARASRRLRGLALLCGVLAGCGGQDQHGAKDVAQGVAKKPDAQSAASKTKTPVIEGDRLTNFGPIVLSKQTETSPFRFREITPGSGVDFVHFSGMTEARHFPTANGSGVAVFDYDNDGKLDLYFATATLLPLGTAQKGPNRLFKNLGGNKFQDVTESSGLGFAGFCHGIIVGDIDNDDDPDVFLCNYGPNVLFLNNGDGTFRDISKSAGIDRPNWSSGGAFLDYDNDGDLDLYVANYGIWKLPDDDRFCGRLEPKRVRSYCSPNTIHPAKHQLYRNNGNLTFTDVYDQVILTSDPETTKPKPRSDGRGFAAVTADLNGDGLIDIYVANDVCPNFLLLNRGDGTFEDATESSGAAYDDKGRAQSGMGVDAEDVNGDGLPDLFATNFTNEYNTLHINLMSGLFMDATPFYGLAADTTPFVGWGTALADFDNDGWPDNFVANGHVDDNRQELGQPYPYAEPALLFANLGGKRFRLATRDAGPYFDAPHVGRGAAFGDIDDDGDIDIVINHRDDAPA
ncbi:MAG: VCBS repeat-containing protein, partial [Planctomycetota bacterium]|nr:VCBS repeat-containing protein [Planctomycetota bacterium]